MVNKKLRIYKCIKTFGRQKITLDIFTKRFYFSAVCVTYKDANVFTDEKGNLGFIINMKKTVHTSDEPEEESEEEEEEEVEDEIDLPRKRLTRRGKSQNSSTEGTSTS